ncbi:MAG: D-alanine--D-alanine ligase, partial [Deltaproteobacteria bacterium]|nr:D-alanine--D-alanine ligase [Deltaproteobacteria bacterium]
MKIAIIYNRESRAVINLFGVPNREKYGLETIKKIRDALKKGGYKVRAFEGDKNIIKNLEEFMPAVIAGERPGLVFNLSYGIQGKSRYTHIPGLLEMLGIPYVGSGPETHAIALDKVVTKMILLQRGLPT